MSIKRPDIYEHNNSNNAIADSNSVRGGFRSAVTNLTALYALSTKIDQLKERSTIVYVTSELKYYELYDINNVGNSGGWRVFLGEMLPVTGATNGLTVSGKNIVLGGTITGDTSINLNNKCFDFKSDSSKYGYANISVNSTYNNSVFGVCSRNDTGGSWAISGNSSSLYSHHNSNGNNGSSLEISDAEIKMINITSSISKVVCLSRNALVYANDYSADYCRRTLVDMEYVDCKIKNTSNIINICRIGNTYTTTALDEFIGVSGTSCVFLYPTPANGQRVIVTDICGNARLDPIRVDGNGICINDGSISTVNTNYGSITYVYNGIFWSVSAFVN